MNILLGGVSSSKFVKNQSVHQQNASFCMSASEGSLWMSCSKFCLNFSVKVYYSKDAPDHCRHQLPSKYFCFVFTYRVNEHPYLRYVSVIFFSREGCAITRLCHSSKSIFPSFFVSASSNVCQSGLIYYALVISSLKRFYIIIRTPTFFFGF
jgi:hypothetical protein